MITTEEVGEAGPQRGTTGTFESKLNTGHFILGGGDIREHGAKCVYANRTTYWWQPRKTQPLAIFLPPPIGLC